MSTSVQGVSGNNTANKTIEQYLKYLPQVTQATNSANASTLNAMVPASVTGQQIENSNAQAGAATNLQQINGAGGDAARAAVALQRATNPDYASTSDSVADKTNQLLGSYNLKGLSAGEQNAVERSQNIATGGTGNLGLSNATNTISNALNFGGAFNNKLTNLNTALGTAGANANVLAGNGGVNTTNVALSQPQTSTQTNVGTNTIGTGTNSAGQLLSTLGTLGNTNQQLQATNNFQNSGQGIAASFSNGIGSCCFIFMEAYEGNMPSYVRKCRDVYYRKYPQVAKGYKRMAKWLVPAMQRSTIIRSLVWLTMVKPLTDHGYSIFNRDAALDKEKYIRKFWFTVWYALGAL